MVEIFSYLLPRYGWLKESAKPAAQKFHQSLARGIADPKWKKDAKGESAASHSITHTPGIALMVRSADICVPIPIAGMV
jgi:hypothetical protein